ncbi:hypothetical protein EV207_1244 [Scopulibacillus darangshiensis]|uniref:DUF2642 domain-containing protein n=1 Tax=Scopulibacillus darangshiensis TaxID=442528 RepID=A0A4R2NRQ9_9BACL|nr:DUF2642 domain-containing protein [Scopulibacillus darangshiensis]TCP24507.1 hypothetical protein EV207_1244 [Scopulibacillus darangshiensis]
MEHFRNFIGETVEVVMSGNHYINGILIDNGPDIIVIYDGDDFLYIPLIHIQFINFNNSEEYDFEKPEDVPIGDKDDSISLRKVLNNAKGIFTEVFVTSNQSIHGYVTSVMNDYLVFFSPVYKEIFIPLNHIKWLMPYNISERPYALNKEEFPITPSNIPLARTFAQQCKKYIGQIVIFDLGNNPNKIGKLVKVDDSQIELIIARNQSIFTNINHVKTVHLP